MFQAKTKILAALSNPKLMNIVVISLLIAFGLLYIVQVNSSASRGLALRALEDQQQDLQVAYQSTTARIDELRSLDSVMQREQLLGLVKVSQISYISAVAQTVALR